MVILVSALIFSGCTQPASAPTPSPAPAPSPAPEPAAKTIKIGVIFGLTGPGSQMQIMLRDASLLCADWINGKGGVNIKGEKYLLECFVEDNKSSMAGSVDAATKLVYEDKVNFIIGTVVPDQTDGVASVTEKNKIINIAAKTVAMHPDRPYSFSGVYSQIAPLRPLYTILQEKYPSVKSVGYIFEDAPGAIKTSEASQGIAKSMGFTVVEPQIHPWENPEYYPQWTKILNLKPDAVDTGLKMPDSQANCVKQGRELGFKGPMFSPVPGDPNLIIKMIGNKEYATDYIYSSFSVHGPEATPIVQEMLKMWKSPTSQLDADGTQPWDAIWCLVQAIEKAQSIDSDAVKNAWESMDTFETALGTGKLGGEKTFGIKHMVFGPLPLTRLNKGEIEFIKYTDSWMP